jgi:hypothetical protein
MTPMWRKSSYSNATGGNCVEVAQLWRKSSHSGGNGGTCVEVADGNLPLVPVRDSKDTTRGILFVEARAWSDFTASLK